MHAVKFLLAIALCLAATLAQAARIRFIDVPADTDGPALTGAMWYPCSAPPAEVKLGVAFHRELNAAVVAFFRKHLRGMD
jgi:hypothetical protein